MAGALGLLGLIAFGVGGRAVAHDTKKDYRCLLGSLIAFGALLIWRHAAVIVRLPQRSPQSVFISSPRQWHSFRSPGASASLS